MGDIASSHHLTLLIIKIIINMGNYFNISVHSLTTEKMEITRRGLPWNSVT